METRANYALIGAFTLTVIFSVFAFVFWFSGAEKPLGMHSYKIIFNGAITGLSVGNYVLFNVVRVGEVDKIAHQVARDIRNQYTIEYTPTDTAMDGTFRQIKIMVKAPGNPSVRTRSGYYATPDQAVASGSGAKGPTSK